jgi:mitochondrial fission protein ELM1
MVSPLQGECWVITDRAAGNQRQALALAGRLGLRVRHLVWEPRAPWSWFAPHLLPGYKRALPPGQRRHLTPPWPRVVIGCGRAASLFTRIVRKLARGRSFAVQILDPRIDPGHWDMVIAPRHDGIEGTHVIRTMGSLNPIDAAWLEDGREASPVLADLPRPRIGVLLGGPRKRWPLDAAYTQALAEHLLARQHREGGSIMVVASRRTPADAVPLLRHALRDIPGLIWGGNQDGNNPYPGVLAWADRLVVTPDSVNMLSEACAVGCPVHTLVTSPLPAKLERFHRVLREAGLLHDIDDAVGTEQTPLRELSMVAGEVLVRMHEHERSANTGAP